MRNWQLFPMIAILAICVALSPVASAQDETSPESYEPAVDTSAAFDDAGGDLAADVPADAGAAQPGEALIAEDVTRRAADNGVMDEIELGRTEITGNQELPKVLYIVPWQKSDPGTIMGRPVNTLLDEVLAPIDREEFIRQVDYYGDLNEAE